MRSSMYRLCTTENEAYILIPVHLHNKGIRIFLTYCEDRRPDQWWTSGPGPPCLVVGSRDSHQLIRQSAPKTVMKTKSFQSISQETYEKVSLFLLVCLPVRNPSGCEIGFSLTASPEYRLPSPGGAGGHLVQLFLLNLYKFEVQKQFLFRKVFIIPLPNK